MSLAWTGPSARTAPGASTYAVPFVGSWIGLPNGDCGSRANRLSCSLPPAVPGSVGNRRVVIAFSSREKAVAWPTRDASGRGSGGTTMLSDAATAASSPYSGEEDGFSTANPIAESFADALPSAEGKSRTPGTARCTLITGWLERIVSTNVYAQHRPVPATSMTAALNTT